MLNVFLGEVEKGPLHHQATHHGVGSITADDQIRLLVYCLAVQRASQIIYIFNKLQQLPPNGLVNSIPFF
jgi:hypothetical protein